MRFKRNIGFGAWQLRADVRLELVRRVRPVSKRELARLLAREATGRPSLPYLETSSTFSRLYRDGLLVLDEADYTMLATLDRDAAIACSKPGRDARGRFIGTTVAGACSEAIEAACGYMQAVARGCQ